MKTKIIDFLRKSTYTYDLTIVPIYKRKFSMSPIRPPGDPTLGRHADIETKFLAT